MTHWFSSDQHFGHIKILDFCNRPFKDVDHMNKALVDNWNDRVNQDDIVWLLGDLSIDSKWKLALELVGSLKGRLRLVAGNHDRCWSGKADFMRYLPEYQKHFEMVQPWARLKFNGDNFKMSHFPHSWDDSDTRGTEYRLPASPGVLLCGHVHDAWKSKANTDSIMVNVGVDQWDYSPVRIDNLVDFMHNEYPDHPALPKKGNG